MIRVKVRSRLSSRRPVSAARAVIEAAPVDADVTPVRAWPVVLVGVLGVLVTAEFVAGLVVIS